jgi:hypothetical protein
VYGLDIPLMRLVNIFKSAAYGYGPERRIILLHGPVGSAKSTIVRLIKKGLEDYSRTDQGRLYTFSWVVPPELARITGGETEFPNPINQHPLLLVPPQWRRCVVECLIDRDRFRYPIDSLPLDYDLDPASRWIYNELLKIYDGDWEKMVSQHVKVRRLILSEKDRVGIGTFQPKDEEKPGFHRTDWRSQLPQDRGIRFGFGPARLQFRWRIQHRQPRHCGIHRNPQTGRGVSVRFAGRHPGAQNQAQEVSADRHRRGHHRPYE